MIIDNTENSNSHSYSYNLDYYTSNDYSYTGNILISREKDYTQIVTEIPYVNRDAGIAFKNWFFLAIQQKLEEISNLKYFSDGKGNLWQKVLVKHDKNSKIVQPSQRKICAMNPGRYNVDRNNGTYHCDYIFPDETLPHELCEILENEFHLLIKTFRKQLNNEITF
jgi:hypothetical protein